MNITLFGAENEVAENYQRAAAQLAKLIGQKHHTLIWGAVDRGLMKVMADTIEENGGKILGVGAGYLKGKMHSRAEIIMAKDMEDRNRIMLEKGDVIVALPGGAGTLNEVTYVLRIRKHGFNKPMIVLNTDNFFGGLKNQLERMSKENFLKYTLEEAIYFAETPEASMGYITTHVD